jgi:hypothetical protein
VSVALHHDAPALDPPLPLDASGEIHKEILSSTYIIHDANKGDLSESHISSDLFAYPALPHAHLQMKTHEGER